MSEPRGGRVVYTIGHSNRSLEEFHRLLSKYRVEVVVDVRRFPKSKKYPYFNRESLEESLRRLGVDYMWLGDLLGGYREGGYESYVKTAGYREGITRLIEVAGSGRIIAVMCSEKLWFKCHRRFIADTLVEEGFKVLHIIDEDRVQEHKLKATR
ncbi:MAG: DUF488 family protein [Desulfurococcus sp.]|nr:DUF488 family protein [Desulfurococcus sp.]